MAMLTDIATLEENLHWGMNISASRWFLATAARSRRISEEGGGSILGKGSNAGSLGADEPEKLVVSDGGDGGFNIGGGGGGDGGVGGGGGGGGGGGEGGEEDYEEKEFGPLLKFEEVMRETEARGATLPSDMLEAAKTFGIRKLILLRYFDLQIVIDSCRATVAEVQKRGKDFWAEFELYVADLLVGVVVNYRE